MNRTELRPIQKFECPVCHKEFDAYDDCEKHALTHTNPDPIQRLELVFENGKWTAKWKDAVDGDRMLDDRVFHKDDEPFLFAYCAKSKVNDYIKTLIAMAKEKSSDMLYQLEVFEQSGGGLIMDDKRPKAFHPERGFCIRREMHVGNNGSVSWWSHLDWGSHEDGIHVEPVIEDNELILVATAPSDTDICKIDSRLRRAFDNLVTMVRKRIEKGEHND